MQQQAAEHAAGGRQGRRDKHPLPAPRLLFDRQQRRRAGPVQQGKQREAHGGARRPAAADEQRAQRRRVAKRSNDAQSGDFSRKTVKYLAKIPKII